MPVCIILVWVLASTGLANLDKEKKKKLLVAFIGFTICCVVVTFYYRSHIYHNFLEVKEKLFGSFSNNTTGL